MFIKQNASIKNLEKTLKEKYKEKIPRMEYRGRGQLTYSLNDYGLAPGQPNLNLITAKDAWDICKDLPKIGTGVTDTYFDLNHPDLYMTLVGGNNNPNVPRATHGTLVAGFIAAVTDNNLGLAFVGFDSPLYVSTKLRDH